MNQINKLFVFKINCVEGSLLLLSQNFVLEQEGAVQELFLNIAIFDIFLIYIFMKGNF